MIALRFWRDETMANTPIAIVATVKAASIMSTIQSSSPIEIAAKSQSRLFTLYVVVLIVGAIAAAVMTVFVYRAGNRYQAAVQTDADARIKVADTRAEEARRGAAEARAESDKANAGLAKSNEEIARLTAEAEKARAERAEADKQIAIAKADAARAKEGIATAEARSLEATAEVSRLRVTVANAETARAKAEKDLLELRERIQPRHLTAAQRTRLVQLLRSFSKGQLDIRCPVGNPEAHDFAVELVAVFTSSGWQASLTDHVVMFPTPVGIHLWLHTDQQAAPGTAITDAVPERAHSIVNAFNSINLSFEGHFDREVPKDSIWLIVGFKP